MPFLVEDTHRRHFQLASCQPFCSTVLHAPIGSRQRNAFLDWPIVLHLKALRSQWTPVRACNSESGHDFPKMPETKISHRKAAEGDERTLVGSPMNDSSAILKLFLALVIATYRALSLKNAKICLKMFRTKFTSEQRVPCRALSNWGAAIRDWVSPSWDTSFNINLQALSTRESWKKLYKKTCINNYIIDRPRNSTAHTSSNSCPLLSYKVLKTQLRATVTFMISALT